MVLRLMFLLLVYFWELQKTFTICDISQNIMITEGST